MSGRADKEILVKESLYQFIHENHGYVKEGAIDEIVLNYVISILDEASAESYFELEAFMEVMRGHLPPFKGIDSAVVCAWFLGLAEEMAQLNGAAYSGSTQAEIDIEGPIKLEMKKISDMVRLPPANQNRSRGNSDNSDAEVEAERQPVIETPLAKKVRMIQEMFPQSSTMEIKHCLSIAHGDAESAASMLLHRRDCGEAMAGALLQSAARNKSCNDNELRKRIIDRYSYVDNNADIKEHKPLAARVEPKKLVRYRDNKIVSLRGERYTEVPKAGVDEEQLRKPKKQHCP